jgi:hypothetical protein
MNGNCICDRLTDGQTDRLRNGEETKSPLRLAGWGLINLITTEGYSINLKTTEEYSINLITAEEYSINLITSEGYSINLTSQ